MNIYEQDGVSVSSPPSNRAPQLQRPAVYSLGLLLSLYLAQGLPAGFVTQALPAILRQYDVSLTMIGCLLYTSPSPRDGLLSRMPSSA